MPRLLVDISAHGYGHLAQTGPVLDALQRLLPSLTLTVRSGLTRERLARRIDVPFRHVAAATDFGYVMRNAVDLDLPATAARYREFHRDWDARVAAEAEWLAANGFDAVLTNVAYLPLAGAAGAGIPAVALCSLNWADLFLANFGGEPWARAIHAEMLDAYRRCTFLRVTPGLPMADLDGLQAVGPVCRLRRPDRQLMARQLGIDPGERWLLAAMGGIDFPLDLNRWPRRRDTRYLVPPALAAARDDVTTFDSEAIDFTALLAAADVVITKPGYGTFVEAACHGRPVLYLPRQDWKEAEVLTEWLHAHAQALPIERQALLAGELDRAIETLFGQPLRPPPMPTGIGEAAAALAAVLAPDARTGR